MPSHRTLLSVVAALLIALAAPVQAASPGNKALALTMARSAKEALKAGKYGLAANMFQEALKLDPKQPDYLYGLARSKHLAGKKVNAETLYRRFLTANPGHRAEDRVRGYLAGLVGDRAQRALANKAWGAALQGFVEAFGFEPAAPGWPRGIAEVVDGATAAGQSAVALKACAELRRLQPTEPAHILRQARAERAAGDLDGAQRHYLEVLTVAGESPEARAAKTELTAVVTDKARKATPAPAPTPPSPARAPEPAVAPPPSPTVGAVTSSPPDPAAAPGAWRRPAGWTATALGVLAVAGGGVTVAMASGAYDDLIGSMSDESGDGRVDTMTRSAAQAELDGINGRKRVGVALLGAGAALAAVGAWWLATAPDDGVSAAFVLPGARGVALEVRW